MYCVIDNVRGMDFHTGVVIDWILLSPIEIVQQNQQLRGSMELVSEWDCVSAIQVTVEL